MVVCGKSQGLEMAFEGLQSKIKFLPGSDAEVDS